MQGNYEVHIESAQLCHRCRPALSSACPPAAPGRYGLRRNAPAGTVCTLEAIARALGVLEGPEIEAHLLTALDRFVERSRAAREGRFER